MANEALKTDDNGMKISITTANGKMDANVIDIFGAKGYEDNDYIMYTFGEVVDNEQEKVYISRLEEDDNNFNFREITDPDEWVAVQNAINEILSNADEGVENVKS